MPTSFWRSPEAQEKLNRLDRSGFAAEFLSRNPDYQRDCDQARDLIAQGKIDPEVARTDLMQRWGASFCLGPKATD